MPPSLLPPDADDLPQHDPPPDDEVALGYEAAFTPPALCEMLPRDADRCRHREG